MYTLHADTDSVVAQVWNRNSNLTVCLKTLFIRNVLVVLYEAVCFSWGHCKGSNTVQASDF
jgi:hypothetical protein